MALKNWKKVKDTPKHIQWRNTPTPISTGLYGVVNATRGGSYLNVIWNETLGKWMMTESTERFAKRDDAIAAAKEYMKRHNK